MMNPDIFPEKPFEKSESIVLMKASKFGNFTKIADLFTKKTKMRYLIFQYDQVITFKFILFIIYYRSIKLH